MAVEAGRINCEVSRLPLNGHSTTEIPQMKRVGMFEELSSLGASYRIDKGSLSPEEFGKAHRNYMDRIRGITNALWGI